MTFRLPIIRSDDAATFSIAYGPAFNDKSPACGAFA
jgi:hypothetical protein